MNAQRTLEQLSERHRETFDEAVRLLRERGDEPWSLDVHCVIIDARKEPSIATIHPVGTLGSVVSISNAIDNPELRKWLEIAAKKGAGSAFTEMFNDDDKEKRKRFALAYDELRREHKEGQKGLWSANDLSEFVIKTKNAFPEGIGCVALLPGENDATHDLLTFERLVEPLVN